MLLSQVLPNVIAGDVENQQRASKLLLQFLKARVLLNKHIYDQLNGGWFGQVLQDSEVDLVDDIAAEGYALESRLFRYFREQQTLRLSGGYLLVSVGNRIWNGMHYKSLPV